VTQRGEADVKRRTYCVDAGGGPLSVGEISDGILERGLVSLRGKTPKATISAQLYVDARKTNGRFERVGRGMLRLRA
jgi:hypothetical protein